MSRGSPVLVLPFFEALGAKAQAAQAAREPRAARSSSVASLDVRGLVESAERREARAPALPLEVAPPLPRPLWSGRFCQWGKGWAKSPGGGAPPCGIPAITGTLCDAHQRAIEALRPRFCTVGPWWAECGAPPAPGVNALRLCARHLAAYAEFVRRPPVTYADAFGPVDEIDES